MAGQFFDDPAAARTIVRRCDAIVSARPDSPGTACLRIHAFRTISQRNRHRRNECSGSAGIIRFFESRVSRHAMSINRYISGYWHASVRECVRSTTNGEQSCYGVFHEKCLKRSDADRWT